MTYDPDPEWDDDPPDEAVDEDGLDDDDSPDDLLACPSCGVAVHEETQCCPHCGEWVMPLASAARGTSRIWIVAAVLAIIGLLLWSIR